MTSTIALRTLTNPQRRALALLSDEWRSADDLREKPRTLDALVRRGLANVQHQSDEDQYRANQSTRPATDQDFR